MIEWREATLKDLDGFKFKSIFDNEDIRKQTILRIRGGCGVTLHIDSKPILIAGVYPVWDVLGVGAIWACVSEEAYKYPLALTKNVKAFIERNAQDLGYWRLDFTVRCDYPKGVKWARLLGFDIEATLKQFGLDKSDYYIMTRLF